MTTTYLGWSQGANEANTEVACVPVHLGGTGLAGHADLAEREAAERAGRGARGDHAGQRVADVGQRVGGHRQVPDDRRLDPLHHLRRSGEISASPIRGLYSVPPLASAA